MSLPRGCVKFHYGYPADAGARPANGLRGGFDPSDRERSTTLKGKAVSAWERKREEGSEAVAHGRAAADKSDRCCVDEIGERACYAHCGLMT